LRGTGLEMLGSVSNEGLVKVVGQLLNAIKPAGMKVQAQAVPLCEVESAWQRSTAERIVFVV